MDLYTSIPLSTLNGAQTFVACFSYFHKLSSYSLKRCFICFICTEWLYLQVFDMSVAHNRLKLNLHSGFIGQKEGEDSAPLMILEYMQYGDLHGFLIDKRWRSILHSTLVHKTDTYRLLYSCTWAVFSYAARGYDIITDIICAFLYISTPHWIT